MALSNTCDVQEPATAVGATKDATVSDLNTLVEEGRGAEDSNQIESCGNTATTDEWSSHTMSSRTTSSSSDVSISGVTPLRAARTFSSASPRTVSSAASDEDSCISSNAGEESTISSITTLSTGRTPSSPSRPTLIDDVQRASAGGERHNLNAFALTTTRTEDKPQSNHNLMEYIDTTSGGRPSRRSRDCGSSVSSLPLSPVRPKGMEERMRKRLSERNLTIKPVNGKDSTSTTLLDSRTAGTHTENHRTSGDSSASMELNRSTGNLDFRLDSDTSGIKCVGSTQSLRGRRSSFSSQRRHASMRNLGSASDNTTRPSRRPRRQSSESSLSAQGGQHKQTSHPGEKQVVAPLSDSSLPMSYEEAMEANRMFQRQLEEQAQQLQEKEHQIQKLLLTQPELGIGVVKEEEEEEDGNSGADKETMRAELKQMKSTMSRLLNDHEESEAGWKQKLEQAQVTANTLSTAMSEAKERISVLEHQVREYEHRDAKNWGGEEDLNEIRDHRDQLLSKVDQLEREREEAEESWKRELEDVRKDAVAKESALEKAQHRIKVLEKRGREGKAPLPPPRTVDADDGRISNDSMRSHDSARSLSSVKIDRQARESYLRQAFSPRKSGRDFQDTAGLIQEAAFPSSSFDEEKEENSKTVEGTREKIKSTRRGSNSSVGQDRLDRKVKTLQNECHVLRSALQAKQAEAEDLKSTLKEKEAESEALRQSVAQIQESEWSIRQDMVKYKDEFEVVLEESLTDKESLKTLQKANQTLRSQLGELELQLRGLREEMNDARERERQWKEAQWDRKVNEIQSEETYRITIDREDPVDEKKMSDLSAASQAAFLEAAMARKRSSSSSALTSSNPRGWGITRLFVNPSIDQARNDVFPDDVIRLAEENSKLRSELVKLKAQYKEESYVNQKKLVELQQHLARAAAE